MVEDEGGMLAAGGCCEGAASWEDGGLGSLVTGAGVWDTVDIGGGETLPVEAGGEDVAVNERDAAGKVALVVEVTASGGASILLEFGPSPASLDVTVPGSCSAASGSSVLLLSTRACLILLKACWRVPDGADRDRPNVIEGAGEGSSPKEVLAEGAPKNCSLRRDSGTGLTMNLRPAECTTWAVVLGEMPGNMGTDSSGCCW